MMVFRQFLKVTFLPPQGRLTVAIQNKLPMLVQPGSRKNWKPTSVG